MFTSAECRANAEAKLAQAERDTRHRRRLINAAECWLCLAGKMKRAEAMFAEFEPDAKRDLRVDARAASPTRRSP
jgi:hypothetical protein